MAIDTVQEHYIYVIGVNQGTRESFSRAYDGNFSMTEWAQHHVATSPIVDSYVELVPEHVYMFMRDTEIMEVRWLIYKHLVTDRVLGERVARDSQ